jgi:hypothetical protein
LSSAGTSGATASHRSLTGHPAMAVTSDPTSSRFGSAAWTKNTPSSKRYRRGEQMDVLLEWEDVGVSVAGPEQREQPHHLDHEGVAGGTLAGVPRARRRRPRTARAGCRATDLGAYPRRTRRSRAGPLAARPRWAPAPRPPGRARRLDGGAACTRSPRRGTRSRPRATSSRAGSPSFLHTSLGPAQARPGSSRPSRLLDCPGAAGPPDAPHRRGGRVVRQGSAKPYTPVQFRSPPRSLPAQASGRMPGPNAGA